MAASEPNFKPVAGKFSLTLADALRDVNTYCNSVEWIDSDHFVNFNHNLIDMIDKCNHKQFADSVVALLNTEYRSKLAYSVNISEIGNGLFKIVSLHGKMNFIRTEKGNGKLITIEPVLKIKKVERPNPVVIIEIEETKNEEIDEKTITNDPVFDVIDDFLFAFKGEGLNDKDYSSICSTLKAFFEGEPTARVKSCFVRNGNKIKLGRALRSIYGILKNDTISYEYLDLCRQLFDCYNDEIIDKSKPSGSNLHKYFTNKTQ